MSGVAVETDDVTGLAVRITPILSVGSWSEQCQLWANEPST